jgi:hypothetical protein
MYHWRKQNKKGISMAQKHIGGDLYTLTVHDILSRQQIEYLHIIDNGKHKKNVYINISD